MLNKKTVLEKLNEIPDPDLGISIVELGLIYDITIGGEAVNILMTLTTPACPLGGTIEKQIKKEFALSHPNSKISITFTFDPLWTMDRISEETKLKLGILT